MQAGLPRVSASLIYLTLNSSALVYLQIVAREGGQKLEIRVDNGIFGDPAVSIPLLSAPCCLPLTKGSAPLSLTPRFPLCDPVSVFGLTYLPTSPTTPDGPLAR